MLRWTALLLLLSSAAAFAQDRQGRDTPGEWKVTHYVPFGLWDSICDERLTDGLLEERCYLRYVEVFSPHPKFAAQFAFVTAPGGTPRIEFGIERGTRFDESGFRALNGDSPVWTTTRRDCLRGRDCVFEGAESVQMITAISGADTFAFDFVDRNGDPQSLRWDLSRFSEAYEDLLRESAARGL